MQRSHFARSPRTAALCALTASFLAFPATVGAQTVFTVNNIAPIVSTGAYVSITAPDALHHNSGTVVNSFTPVTFGTNSYYDSPGAAFGVSNPGLTLNGAITGTSIPAGTVMPVSYNFTLGKNAFVPGTVTWTLSLSDNQNSTPFQIASGSLTTSGAASQLFSGVGNSYTFTTGGSTTFATSMRLTYTSIDGATDPRVTIAMANSGFGGGGITFGASAIPEPSTYAAIAGAAMLGLAVWRRRRQSAPASVTTA
jgi:hypothetical protein